MENLNKHIIDSNLNAFKDLLEQNPNQLFIPQYDLENPTEMISPINLIIQFSDVEFFKAILHLPLKDFLEENKSLFNSIVLTSLEEKSYEFLELFIDTYHKNNIVLNYNITDENDDDLISKYTTTPITLLSNNKTTDRIEETLLKDNFNNDLNFNAIVHSAILSKNKTLLTRLFNNQEYRSKISEKNYINLFNNKYSVLFKEIIDNNPDAISFLNFQNTDKFLQEAISQENIILTHYILYNKLPLLGASQMGEITAISSAQQEDQDLNKMAQECLDYILSLHPRYSDLTSNGTISPWGLAIENKNDTLFSYLLEDKKALQKLDDFSTNDNPLSYAIQTRNHEFIAKILEQKPYLLLKDSKGNTPLLRSILLNDTESALLFLKEYNNGVNEPNDRKETPLNIALGKRNIPIISALVWAGAEIDYLPRTQDLSFDLEMIEEGEYRKFNLDKKIVSIKRFTDLAVLGFKLNQQNDAGEYLINYMVKKYHFKNFANIVKSPVNINNVDSNGNSTLMLTALTDADDKYALTLLKIRGGHIDYTIKNNNGENIYDIVLKEGKPEIAIELLSKDFNISLDDFNKIYMLAKKSPHATQLLNDVKDHSLYEQLHVKNAFNPMLHINQYLDNNKNQINESTKTNTLKN